MIESEKKGALRTAQGIVCGPWAFAFEFGWARSIVDNFDMVAVPQAREWLVGAANIDGELLPVIDLQRLVAPAQAGAPEAFVRKRDHRLLVGGTGAQSIAMLFTRLPQMLRYEPRDGDLLGYAPAAIRAVTRGIATNPHGESYLEIDGPKLVDMLAELSG